jgi:signal peptidase II
MQRARLLGLSLALFAVDQATKFWVDAHPDWGHSPRVIIPGIFDLVSWRNPGALFSFLAESDSPWRRLILTLFPAVAVVLLVYLIVRADTAGRLTRLGYALVLGGAAGNLFDRVVRGSVVDFLRFGVTAEPVRGWLDGVFGTHYWPAFNVADSAICVGAAVIAWEILRSSRHAPVPNAPDPL